MSTCGSPYEHDLAAAEQRAERGPLTARVHQRSERERDELLDAVARREERPQSLRGVVEHRRRDLLGRGDRRPARVAAAEPAEEHVLLAPHHALGPAGRAAGVEHVAVVGGPGTEVARRRSRLDETFVGRASRPRPRAVNAGERTASTCAAVSASWKSATRSASSHRYSQLVGDVAVVDVDRERRGPCSTRASPRRGRPSCAGRGRRGRRCRRRRRASRARAGSRVVELARRCGASHCTRPPRVGHRVGHALEQVGDVELHARCSGRS